MGAMPLQIAIGPLALFTLVASITPGPNNLLLMRSGARFGVRRSLWHLAGIWSGMLGLLTLSHLGIGALLLAMPSAFIAMRWASSGYLMILALTILRDTLALREVAPTRGKQQDSEAASTSMPMRWHDAALFQLINPKAWMMAVTITTGFHGETAPGPAGLATAALVSTLVGAPCMLVWTIWGAAINQLLKKPSARQAFGYAMTLLVLATAIWMLF
jgi:threonine/homoserine/homoserine lactone efflux protein